MKNYTALGKLTKEQKEEKWATTLSGSQAWSLVNEPYNLLRKKLGIEPIHASKFDFFSESQSAKAVGENAMANGTHYEEWVISEIRNHIPNLVSEDICYQPNFPEGHRLKQFESYITATPDWLLFNEAGGIEIMGEVKCSTSAADMNEMRSRYYTQLLHNSFVLQSSHAQLWTKNEITKPINNYIYNFSEADFAKYEEVLFTFFSAWANATETFYDALGQVDDIEFDTDPALENLFSAEELPSILSSYVQAKEQVKGDKSIVDKFEKTLKTAWINGKSYDLGGVTLTMTVKKTDAKLSSPAALQGLMQKYNIPQNELDAYMSEGTTKTIKVIRKEQ